MTDTPNPDPAAETVEASTPVPDSPEAGGQAVDPSPQPAPPPAPIPAIPTPMPAGPKRMRDADGRWMRLVYDAENDVWEWAYESPAAPPPMAPADPPSARRRGPTRAERAAMGATTVDEDDDDEDDVVGIDDTGPDGKPDGVVDRNEKVLDLGDPNFNFAPIRKKVPDPPLPDEITFWESNSKLSVPLKELRAKLRRAQSWTMMGTLGGGFVALLFGMIIGYNVGWQARGATSGGGSADPDPVRVEVERARDGFKNGERTWWGALGRHADKLENALEKD